MKHLHEYINEGMFDLDEPGADNAVLQTEIEKVFHGRVENVDIETGTITFPSDTCIMIASSWLAPVKRIWPEFRKVQADTISIGCKQTSKYIEEISCSRLQVLHTVAVCDLTLNVEHNISFGGGDTLDLRGTTIKLEDKEGWVGLDDYKDIKTAGSNLDIPCIRFEDRYNMSFVGCVLRKMSLWNALIKAANSQDYENDVINGFDLTDKLMHIDPAKEFGFDKVKNLDCIAIDVNMYTRFIFYKKNCPWDMLTKTVKMKNGWKFVIGE